MIIACKLHYYSEACLLKVLVLLHYYARQPYLHEFSKDSLKTEYQYSKEICLAKLVVITSKSG